MADVPSLLGQVLAYVDRPWKAAVVFCLIVTCGAGWFTWDQRAVLLEAWLTPDAPELRVDAIPAALDRLVVETQADLVQIWSVDMQANAQRFIGARRNDGERPVIPNPRRLPIIVTTTDVKALVSVISGTPVCGDLKDEGSPLIRRLAGRGMKRACAIPIPTSPEAFVGVIYLGWLNPPAEDAENIAVAAAREIAGQLSTK